VVVAAVIGFAVFGRRTPTPDQPDRPPDRPVQPVNKYSAEELEGFRKNHANTIKLAQSCLDGGDIANAKINLHMARFISKEINEKAIFDTEQAFENQIRKAETKLEFQRSLAQADREVQNRDLQKAADLVRALKTSGSPDDECAKQLDQKSDLITVLQRAKIRRDAFLETLKAAADLPEDKIDDTAKTKLDAAGKQLPAEEEAKTLLAIAPWLMPEKEQWVQLQNKFSEALANKAKERKYKQYLDDAEASLDPQKKVDFLQDALALFPQRDEVREKLVKAKAKLSETDRQRVEREREAKTQQQFTEAYNRAQQLRATDLEGALAAVKEALAIKNDALATELKDNLDRTLQTRRDRGNFKTFLAVATDILDSKGNLETAENSLRDAKKLFENDPELKTLEVRLDRAKQEANRRKAYLDLVAKAQTAMAGKSIEETQKYYRAALEIDGTGHGLKGVAEWLDKEEKKKAQALSLKQKYDAALSDAAELENAGDNRQRPEEQVNDYNKALAKYDEAKAFGPAKDANVTAVKEKLAKAEDARKRAELAAAQEIVRKEFQQKWVAAESARGMEQWDDALTALQAAKTLLKDNPVFASERDKADKKIVEYRTARDQQAAARAQQAVLEARTAIATKIKAKDFRNASLEAEKLGKANATVRAELRDVVVCLTALQAVDATLVDIVKRLKPIENNAKVRAADERRQLETLRTGLQSAFDEAALKLAAPECNASALRVLLEKEAARAPHAASLLKKLEALGSKPPDNDPPLDVPDPKPKPKPDPKPKNSSGSVGENIPD
jgi:hypothetical protein